MEKTDYIWLKSLESRIVKLEDETKPQTIKVKKLYDDVKLPSYQTEGSVCMDIHAYTDKDVTVYPGDIVAIPTGLAIQLPHGYEAQVRSRSGLSLKGVCVCNSPGTIDEDFFQEIKVILRNDGPTFYVHKGDRIAQLAISKVVRATWEVVPELKETERKGGFGSTGI